MLIDFTQDQVRDLQTLVLSDAVTANQRISPASRIALAIRLHLAISDFLEGNCEHPGEEEAFKQGRELVN